MDNFLTTLYFELFETRKNEKRLRKLHTFSSDNDAIRNDQSIIDKYMTMKENKII